MDDAIEGFSPRRLIGIVFVALLHAALIYALINGLGVRTAQIFEHPLTVKIIQPPKLLPPAPPPPPPLLAPPPPFIPPPLVQIAQPPPPPVIAQVTRVKPVAPPVIVPPPARPVAPKPAAAARAAMLDPNQSCAPPQYPQDAEDMEQTGTSILQFLISPAGSVLQSRIASSSGHASLDAAAEQALGQCRFRPAIGGDGQPREAWTSIRYVWQLN